MIHIFTKHHYSPLHIYQFISGSISTLTTPLSKQIRHNILKRKLTDKYRRCFKMNTLMLYTHHNNPKRIIPANWHSKWQGINYIKNCLFCIISILPNLRHRRPVIVIIIQIIPTHLVNPNSKYRFKLRIYSLINNLTQIKLIYKKHSSMPKIKQNYMSQRISAMIKHLTRLKLRV